MSQYIRRSMGEKMKRLQIHTSSQKIIESTWIPLVARDGTPCFIFLFGTQNETNTSRLCSKNSWCFARGTW